MLPLLGVLVAIMAVKVVLLLVLPFV